ncbi:alpha/beta hydrolase [Ensifer sp. YR511]|uniref:alpha/beta hydrolase n=1 Tax=Ensifer sp. YR511 TaxID=1855294 RepID=UPI0008904B8E|nr:phospholipase [Ensifer sp. YR511]SDN79420.1 phospholipase/carboxylesterase [Ensifer sp. YR511]
MSHHHEPLFLGAPPQAAKVLCIFAHGRTQSPEDMLDQVITKLDAPNVAFALPRAAANSWYSARATDALTSETRIELNQSLDYLRTVVVDLVRAGGGEKPLLIGGFSQGACLSLEYSMKYGPWNGAMANLTGCRVGTSFCDRPFADLNHMPVYLTGADRDPWISVDAFASAVETLGRGRSRLLCELFPDRSHEVSEHEVAIVNALLADLAEVRKPFQVRERKSRRSSFESTDVN